MLEFLNFGLKKYFDTDKYLSFLLQFKLKLTLLIRTFVTIFKEKSTQVFSFTTFKSTFL